MIEALRCLESFPGGEGEGGRGNSLRLIINNINHYPEWVNRSGL